MKTSLVRTALTLVCVLCGSSSFADNCDSKCRMRYHFFVCGTTTYWKMMHEDCYMCYQFGGAAGYGVCEKVGDSTNTTCTDSGTNQWKRYTSADLRCDCDARYKNFIETFAPTGPVTEWMDTTRWVCPTQ